MKQTVFVKNYSLPPIKTNEVLRYAGGTDDIGTTNLLSECLKEVKDILNCAVCYKELSLKICGDVCQFGEFNVISKNLAKNLEDCNRVVLFGATLGLGIDRLIAKYSKISPSKALIFQAIGAERVETLCDTFCHDIKNSLKIDLKPRFSAGYGDLPLETQKVIFASLNCAKHIGLTLNDSLLMSPTKSVTAFVGIREV